MVSVSNAYPNPVYGNNVVRFDLLSSCPTTVDWGVYTVSLRKVYGTTVSVNGPMSVAWDLHDASGARVAVGLYYIQVNSGANPVQLKVLVQN